MTAYAELAVTTNFSFLRGASHPQEMVATADALGLAAIGIADRNSFAGVVRAYDEWRKRQEPSSCSVGTRLVTIDGFEVDRLSDRPRRLWPALPPADATAIASAKGEKGECQLTFEDILAASDGQIFIALPPEELSSGFYRAACRARASGARPHLPRRRASLSRRRAAPARPAR